MSNERLWSKGMACLSFFGTPLLIALSLTNALGPPPQKKPTERVTQLLCGFYVVVSQLRVHFSTSTTHI